MPNAAICALASACKLELVSTATSCVCIATICDVPSAAMLEGLNPIHWSMSSATIWFVVKDSICTADSATSCDVANARICVSVKAAARGGPITDTVRVPSTIN